MSSCMPMMLTIPMNSSPRVFMSNQSVYSTGASGTRVAGWRSGSSSSTETKNALLAGAYAFLETWLLTGAASDYDIRATLTAGTNPTSGTMSTWLNMGTQRTWENQMGSVGIKESYMTMEIRDATTLAVLTTKSVSIIAERT